MNDQEQISFLQTQIEVLVSQFGLEKFTTALVDATQYIFDYSAMFGKHGEKDFEKWNKAVDELHKIATRNA